jgi:hypothetical protein
MGNHICGVIINSLPKFNENENFDESKLKVKFEKVKLENLSPEYLSIGFKDNATLIFLNNLFFYNISDKEKLTPLENDINCIYPKSNFFIPVINETANFVGYSIIENGIKIRTKAVVNDNIFLDYGDINNKEMELYEESLKKFKSAKGMYELAISKFKDLTELELKKKFLELRDAYYKKENRENEFNYTDGSLDENIIEQEFNKYLNCSFYELNEIDFIQFKRKKFHLKKESLKEFIKIAYEQLS